MPSRRATPRYRISTRRLLTGSTTRHRTRLARGRRCITRGRRECDRGRGAAPAGGWRRQPIHRSRGSPTRARTQGVSAVAYLNVDEIESALENLAAAYPATTELITVPNLTHEG